jgi:hypothetical protein
MALGDENRNFPDENEKPNAGFLSKCVIFGRTGIRER